MFSQSDILQTLPKQFFASLVAKVNAKVAQGYDVINLGQGNPDQPTYDYSVDALIESAKNPVRIIPQFVEMLILKRQQVNFIRTIIK